MIKTVQLSRLCVVAAAVAVAVLAADCCKVVKVKEEKRRGAAPKNVVMDLGWHTALVGGWIDRPLTMQKLSVCGLFKYKKTEGNWKSGGK